MKTHHLVVACVLFEAAQEFEDRATGKLTRSRGYMQKFGVSIEASESLREILQKITTDGTVDWKETSVETIDWESMNDELRSSAQGFGQQQVWHTGPKFAFP